MRIGSGWIGRSACLVSVCAAVWAGEAARADDYLDRANAFYRNVGAERRSDTVLLPALAKMDAPPIAPPTEWLTLDPVLGFGPGGAGWNSLESWASAPAQQAVIDALAAATKETSWQRGMVFGQPYGVDGVSLDLVRARLYTELGDPPTLAAAQFYYLAGLDRLALLVHVEASRRAADGKVGEAAEVLANLAFLGRQMCDRQFDREVAWGLRQIALSMERIRDVVYADWRGGKTIDRDRLNALIERLDEEKSDLIVSRPAFPEGMRVAAEQMVARVMVERGGVREDVFAAELARLRSTERPLRLFAENARWRRVAGLHRNWFDVTENLAKTCDDWAGRWRIGFHEPRNSLPFHVDRLDPTGYALLTVVLRGGSDLFSLRQIARTEVVGTRQALALLAYWYQNKEFAISTAGTRPRWLTAVPADPYNPNVKAGQVPPFEYFVPIRDTRDQFGAREEPRPHQIDVFTTSGQNFKVAVGQDQFVLYSVGSDFAKNWARRVQNVPQRVERADYLIWPPVASLHRQHLRDIGRLK